MSRQPITLRYQVQTQRNGKWVTVAQETSRAWCQGYLARVRETPGLRNAWRLLDTKTGKAIEGVSEGGVNLGQIAGWPTAEQYERAAADALAMAQRMREREARLAERRGDA